MNRDSFKLITQLNGDGGDTSNREGIYYSLLGVLDAKYDDVGRPPFIGFNQDLQLLTASSNIFRRHPDQSKWYSWPKCFSRDQHAALMLGAAALNQRSTLELLWKGFLKRVLIFHQNTQEMGPDSKRTIPDILSPGQLTTLIRGLKLWWLYPVLLVLDAVLCLDNIFRKKTLWDYDNLVAARLMYDLKTWPTVFTYVNRYFYKKTDYKARILNYYSAANNGVPDLGDLYVKACVRLIDGSNNS